MSGCTYCRDGAVTSRNGEPLCGLASCASQSDAEASYVSGSINNEESNVDKDLSERCGVEGCGLSVRRVSVPGNVEGILVCGRGHSQEPKPVPSWLLGPTGGHVVLSARRELRAEGFVWRYVIKPSERVSVGPLSSVKAVEVLTGDAGFGNFGIGVVGARGLLHAAEANQGRWISIETGEATS